MHSSSPELTPAVRQLIDQLGATEKSMPSAGPFYHVDGVGGHFYFAYEQLRNAAEYRERHLLLRGAIERFLVRHVDLAKYRTSAAELITELTQAGYVPNHTVPIATLAAIDDRGAVYSNYYAVLRQTGRERPEVLKRWMTQLLSVQLESLLVPTSRRLSSFIAFTYGHYLNAIDFSSIEGADKPEQDQTALYCAIHRTIFKSDLATTRYYALSANLQDLQAFPPADFVSANQLIDVQYQSPLTNRVGRVVGRYAAPIRIMRELFVTESISAESLAKSENIASKVRSVCQQQYQLTEKTASDRLLRTIIFVFMTKILIGVGIEVPYDLLRANMIVWQPLIINIVFPPVYMMLIGLQAKAPGRQNTEVIVSYVERIMYESGQPPITYKLRRRVTSPALNRVFIAIYSLGFTLSFGLLIWMLHSLSFNAVNGLIFFIFFSAVSFLGFRLRQAAGELRMLPERQNMIQILVDFLSTPFVRVGHWLSDRYAKANIVTRLLDAAIELPLKTSLRLVQQWVGFMRDKQEEL